MAYTIDNVISELDQAGVGYSCPICVNVTDLSGFFSSNRNVKYGGAAVSDRDTLLLSSNGLLSGSQLYELAPMGMTKLSVKKVPLLSAYLIDVRGMADGKKYRFKIQFSTKGGKAFPDQQSNAMSLINTLEKWAAQL